MPRKRTGYDAACYYAVSYTHLDVYKRQGFMRCWLTGPKRRSEPMFEAYITNTALYPLMGIEVGTTLHFPMTTQELQAALAKIGIDGKRYSEVFFTSFDSCLLYTSRCV